MFECSMSKYIQHRFRLMNVNTNSLIVVVGTNSKSIKNTKLRIFDMHVYIML